MNTSSYPGSLCYSAFHCDIMPDTKDDITFPWQNYTFLTTNESKKSVIIGPLQLGSRDHNLLKILHNMGYNLKNARNGKSVSKISKWPSLKSLALKSKLIRQFFENLEHIYGK